MNAATDALVPCPACRRHHLASEPSCPFCASPAPRGRPLGASVMAVLTPVILAACYGAPPYDDSGMDTSDPSVDVDGDGYDASQDCDDADAGVNPGATEVCDDAKDNDCDGKTDADDTDCAGG